MIDAVLTDHRDDILDMRRRGISKKEISLTFHVNIRHVTAALDVWGDTFPATIRERLDDMKEQIIAEWRGGATRKELAQRYGSCLDTMQRKLREWGESKPRGGRYNKHEMQRLRDAGLTGEEVAQRLGCTVAMVYAYSRSPEVKSEGAKPEPLPLPEYKAGEKYGRFRFVGKVEGRRSLWLFQHVAAGWKETFTELQLREARIA